MKISIWSSFAALLVGSQAALAANWPSWRGPEHDGVTAETELPLSWSAQSGVRWQAALPERGNSTPVIWGGKVLITQALTEGDRRTVMCFDAHSGKLLWQSGVKYSEPELTHATNPFCAASPVTDGERVIASFGSAGLFCCDLDGAELWRRDDLGAMRHIWGNASSPIIEGDRVFLNFGPGERTRLICFDKRSGKTLWEHAEPGGASGEGSEKHWTGAWSDPLVRTVGGTPELFMTYPGRVCAFRPGNGEELWTCDGLNPLVYNSPLFADGMVVAMGGYNGTALAVRAGGHGNVTATHRLWQLPKVSQRIGSGVVFEGRHYIVTDGGMAECRDLQTGDLIYQERLKGPGSTHQNWSSLVRSGERLFAVDQSGCAFVIRAAPSFELLATNFIGEKVIASMAPSDGCWYIRSYEHLWCIGN